MSEASQLQGLGGLEAASEQSQNLSRSCTGGERQAIQIIAESGCADTECHCTQLQFIITYNFQN